MCNFVCQDSYYLSAEECITSGYFQNQHPNPCRLSRDGFFGSKFVTVVATGLFYKLHMQKSLILKSKLRCFLLLKVKASVGFSTSECFSSSFASAPPMDKRRSNSFWALVSVFFSDRFFG